ncbi:uncharacterized protein BO97DRAFT_414284 [Aspergillus homomorphus CBS 101889]|uniref:Carboxylesterase type B domain-containing protein n=1 Tax=Aspergillus homomorphus (strain CBS 101889) TaxID=1450537 RepID=A0A395HX77_ASPHC|nr:hypothetical protein BO97DRAFT_414284 [Aspergillus homomorphus CBS 101889]RAL12511.1 hypothetical protein BO97DRAFT_414284 [Aspergillus homomorphus CBS 101889]
MSRLHLDEGIHQINCIGLRETMTTPMVLHATCDYVVEERMSNYWANFIRTGNPNGDELPEFPPSTKEKKQTMWLGISWGSGSLSADDSRVQFVEGWLATMPEW